MKTKLGKIAIRIRYATLLLRLAGIMVFFKLLLQQIYSRSVQIGFTMDLQKNNVPEVVAKLKYKLQLATQKDMDEILQLAKLENKDMAQKLIYRILLWEDGYRNCYIARTADTNEICFMQFTIFAEDAKTTKGGFKSWFPELKEGEALIEGAYTFEKFRGNRIHPAVTADQLKICKEKGVQRMVAHVNKNNTASLKGTERAGYVPFEEASNFKFMFITRRGFSPRTTY
jgi:hypothetical protein